MASVAAVARVPTTCSQCGATKQRSALFFVDHKRRGVRELWTSCLCTACLDRMRCDAAVEIVGTMESVAEWAARMRHHN